MDIAEIEKLLNQTKIADDDDVDDVDLDAELEAILSGRAPIRQTRHNSRNVGRVPEYIEPEPAPDYDNDDAKLERELARFIGNLDPPEEQMLEPQPPPLPVQPRVRAPAPPPQAPRPAPLPQPIQPIHPQPVQGVRVLPPQKVQAPQPPRPVAAANPGPSSGSRLEQLRDAYKKEAILAKKSGRVNEAIEHLRTAKTVEALIAAEGQGQPIDPSTIPPMPSSSSHANIPSSSHAASAPASQPAAPIADLAEVEVDEVERKKLFAVPDQAGSLSDALHQRLEKYRSTQSQAEAEGNSSKARRIGRIVKQYENALKANKAGKEFDYESLPNPPGWDDLPLNAPQAVAPAPAPQKVKTQAPQPPAPAPAKPAATAAVGAAKTLPKPRAPQPSTSNTMPGPKRQSSIANKQLAYLQKRQQLFKEAALEAKRQGDLNKAKEYLRQSKGFDPLIEATMNGLPIDSTSIPTPPQLADDFVMVSKNVLGEQPAESASVQNEESGAVLSGERDELFRKVEVELTNQIEMCQRNRDYFNSLGDVTSGKKFEKFSKDTAKDLDMLRAHWVNQDRLPKFHYEQRSFSIVICNTDLSVNELSVDVIKAINLPVKADFYCRLEFPFPTDNPPMIKTRTVRDAINPEFNEHFKFDIDRKSRSLARVFKRHSIKIELWSKGGFLRSDNLFGTVQIKLTDFESKCQLHDGFAIMDGRKATGAKLEIKVRIREPLLSKQVEEIQAKWLVFD